MTFESGNAPWSMGPNLDWLVAAVFPSGHAPPPPGHDSPPSGQLPPPPSASHSTPPASTPPAPSPSSGGGAPSCTASCSAEFVKCFHFWSGKGEGADSAYGRCRSQLDGGDPDRPLPKAGCVVGCVDTDEMTGLLGGDGSSRLPPVPPAGSPSPFPSGRPPSPLLLSTLESNSRASPQMLSEVCNHSPEHELVYLPPYLSTYPPTHNYLPGLRSISRALKLRGPPGRASLMCCLC